MRAEPQLTLGWAEVLRLAPLVTEWRRRGASELHIAGSLTSGLPRAGVYHPARFVETRLVVKMPPERGTAPLRPECDGCGVPVLSSGLCGSCREDQHAGAQTATDSQILTRGVAKARAALRGLSIENVIPALA